MPRQYLMSWEGPPNSRWVKMYRGQRYRVTCAELGAMVWTKEATGKLANKWWEKKLAELTGPSPVAQVLQAVEEMPIHKLRELMERGDAVKKILAELPFVKKEIAPEEVGRIVGEAVTDENQALGKISEVVGKITADQGIPSHPGPTHPQASWRTFSRFDVRPEQPHVLSGGA